MRRSSFYKVALVVWTWIGLINICEGDISRLQYTCAWLTLIFWLLKDIMIASIDEREMEDEDKSE